MPVLPVENLLPIFRSADNKWGTTSLFALTEYKVSCQYPSLALAQAKAFLSLDPSSEGGSSLQDEILRVSTAGPLVVNSLRGITRHQHFAQKPISPFQ